MRALSSIIRKERVGGAAFMNMNTQELQIQRLLDGFLNNGGDDTGCACDAGHLDEEMLNAFIEGALTEREAAPVTKHLVDCSFCRHVSAKLIRLDLAFSEGRILVPEANGPEPTPVSEVINGLFSRIFGSSEGAVFAHGEKDREDEDTEKPDGNGDRKV